MVKGKNKQLAVGGKNPRERERKKERERDVVIISFHGERKGGGGRYSRGKRYKG